ncbi:E1-E2 ATPase-domain-containing protein [Microdochium bolleyi]|uniref:E1-E2 ATPase-domain-containing protein n=1 Tax=Microdochium bolleyi TaxID=196109 RepID=A0A136IJK4_9PEZI|nr:E1-E2 ATPase-domain-containing protein [Microdochium bolleyi]
MKKKGDDPLAGHVSGQSNKPLSRPLHSLTFNDVVKELESDEINGLHTAVAKQRLDEFGPNDLGEADGVSPVKIIIAQIANAMTLVLIMAMAGGVITFVILLNVIVGFFREYSAEKTMDSLRSLSSPTASVVRDGKSSVIPSGDIVPGDLIELKTGDIIPADARYA